MHERENVLKEWLFSILKNNDFTLTPLYGDASFRRYYRLVHQGLTQVVMDAPPGKEDLEPFIHIDQVLAQNGILTPKIIAHDLELGFLLMSDFGDVLLLNVLNSETVANYYQQAMDTLLTIQTCSIDDPKLPDFNNAFMMKEMDLCPEWFFKHYLSLAFTNEEQDLLQSSMHAIAQEVAEQPLVFIHRDYHSRNLMLTEDQTMAVIDFQDAMRGPLTYDLVSLLKDCYIAWPRTKTLEWVAYFHQHSPQAQSYSLAEFIRAFDLCGLQRHLKVLGVFSRLKLRDNKPGYIKDLPLTLSYVLECTAIYKELHPLHQLLQQRVYLP